MADDGQGIQDTVDAQNYVRSLGAWNTLAGTTEITTLQTDLGTAQTDITNLQALFPIALNDLSDVDLSTPATLNQILKYNGTNFTPANESGGVTSLAALTDVNLGVLSNGDILSYDLANTEWVNSGLSLTPATLEYMQFKSLTGTCEISPNTVGEWGVSSAIGWFTATPTSGTCIFDTSASAGIISVINTK